MEVWKNIEGYGSYAVSNLGRVKSLNYNGTGREKILKSRLTQNGYLSVILCKDRKMKAFRIHRLVAREFIPNPHNYPQVNHKNEIKTDNRACNLEWCTCSYNVNYGTHNERVAKSNSVPIIQRDMDNNFIKEWESSMQIERELGIWQSNIINCCKGKRKTAGGFKWEYTKKAEK